MKVILDNIIFSLQKVGGISTYWYELSSRMLRDHIDVLFIDRENYNLVAKQLSIQKGKKITAGFKELVVDRFTNVSLKEVDDKFIFHSSYNRRTTNRNAKQVITVHDFVHEKFYNGIRRIIHSYQKGKAIKKADAIIVISENTKKDLLYFFPKISPSIIHVIYNGVSEDFFSKKNKKSSNSFLFIGSREKYKNFDFTVKAVAQLEGFTLKIIGSSLRKEELNMLNRYLSGRWELFSQVENETLNGLYNDAYALIYPSSYEGFGIPLLEAMKSGCPFIALNCSSIPEVAGEAGVLIDKLEISLFNDAIARIDESREGIIKKGFDQANKFSWEKCYRETLNVYNELYES